jgi:hypothetical protein
VLVNHSNTGVHRVAWALEVDSYIIDENLATIALIQTIEHIHEGRFAGTVFAEKANDLPGLNDQIDVVVRYEVAKAFGDASEF